MIFTEEHREKIRRGEKTVTRRRRGSHGRQPVTKGKTYRATLGGNVEQGMFTARSECDCFIKVMRVYRQPLGYMTGRDAAAEGGYTLAEFKRLWRELHGEWNDGEAVWVIEFEYAGDEDPEVDA